MSSTKIFYQMDRRKRQCRSLLKQKLKITVLRLMLRYKYPNEQILSKEVIKPRDLSESLV